MERFVMADRGFLRFSTKEGFEFYADVQWPRAMLPASGAACWMEGAADCNGGRAGGNAEPEAK